MRRTVLILFATATFALPAAMAQAATVGGFHAVFHDVGFQNGCTPPIVFCGSGEIAGFGSATTVVRVTSNVPIAGTDCTHATGLRWLTLDDGSGTLVASFDGVHCPLGKSENAFGVDFTWTVDSTASSGVFAGATGGGTGTNTTGAGAVQVASMTGTLTLL